MKPETQNKIKKAIAGLAVTGLLLLNIQNIAHATTLPSLLYYQTTSSATQSATLADVIQSSNHYAGQGQKLGTGLIGTVTTSTIYLTVGGGLSPITAGVVIACYNDSAYTSYNSSCSGTSAAVAIAASTAKTAYSFATPVVFDPTKYYSLEMGCNAACNGSPGTNPDFYTSGSNSNIYTGGNFNTGYTIVDAYFTLYGQFDLSIIMPSIPVTLSTTTAGLIYGSATSTMQDCSAYSGGIFSSSTLQALGCYLTNSLQTALVWLFVPQTNALGMTTFNNAIQSFQNVFPFNIFFNFASILNNNATAYVEATDTITVNLGQSIPGALSVSYTSLTNMMSTSTYSLIRSTESYAIWLLTGFEIVAVVTGFHFISKKKKHKKA